MKILTVILLLFALTIITPSSAEIKSLKIRSDNRPMILFEKFGFTHTGFVSVAISAVSVTSSLSQPDPSRLGFFLLSEESLIQVLLELQQNPNFCVVDSKFISLLFTFRDLSPPPQSSFNKSYPVTSPNEYSLFFANCNPESLVTMDVRTELYNLDDGNTKDYLSAGLTQLPGLYFVFSLVYLGFVFALKTIAAYKYQWVSSAAEEIASLAFYLVMFYMFRPVEKNEYFVLDDEDEEAAELALRDEEFEL